MSRESKFADEVEESKVAQNQSSTPQLELKMIMGRRETGDLLSNLYPFYQAKIAHGLEEFYATNLDEFDPDSDENKLIYWDIFQEFEELFEGFLQEFIQEHDLDKETFYEELHEASSNADKRSSFLLKMISAQTDFNFFVELMKTKARDSQYKGKRSPRQKNHK